MGHPVSCHELQFKVPATSMLRFLQSWVWFPVGNPEKIFKKDLLWGISLYDYSELKFEGLNSLLLFIWIHFGMLCTKTFQMKYYMMFYLKGQQNYNGSTTKLTKKIFSFSKVVSINLYILVEFVTLSNIGYDFISFLYKKGCAISVKNVSQKRSDFSE